MFGVKMHILAFVGLGWVRFKVELGRLDCIVGMWICGLSG